MRIKLSAKDGSEPGGKIELTDGLYLVKDNKSGKITVIKKEEGYWTQSGDDSIYWEDITLSIYTIIDKLEIIP